MERKRFSSSSSIKLERKIIEKNRRNQLKNLFSQLNSLLPNQTSKGALPLPDQIDEAIRYIKILETKLKECKQKKENLIKSEAVASSSSKAPEIEIHEKGSNLQVVLTSGINYQFIFYEVIRILHEDGAEVLNANFSVVGNKVFHFIDAEIKDTIFEYGAAKITERLKRCASGSGSQIETLLQELSEFEINPELME